MAKCEAGAEVLGAEGRGGVRKCGFWALRGLRGDVWLGIQGVAARSFPHVAAQVRAQ